MIEWMWRPSNFLSSRHDVRTRLRWKWENLYCAGYLLFGWEQDFILWAYQWVSVSEYSQSSSTLISLSTEIARKILKQSISFFLKYQREKPFPCFDSAVDAVVAAGCW